MAVLLSLPAYLSSSVQPRLRGSLPVTRSTRCCHGLGLTPGSWSRHAGAEPWGSGSAAAAAESIARSTPRSCNEATSSAATNRRVAFTLITIPWKMSSAGAETTWLTAPTWPRRQTRRRGCRPRARDKQLEAHRPSRLTVLVARPTACRPAMPPRRRTRQRSVSRVRLRGRTPAVRHRRPGSALALERGRRELVPFVTSKKIEW